MKASKFTDAQKAFVINQGEEGPPVAETREPSANPHV
jgi:putative transposase